MSDLGLSKITRQLFDKGAHNLDFATHVRHTYTITQFTSERVSEPSSKQWLPCNAYAKCFELFTGILLLANFNIIPTVSRTSGHLLQATKSVCS